ncbi:predicted protein [Uncinocarpus reesii 1704]|uniref:Uncharacterized protein n=1 Tax=Uncinocarpus reesii (strain UAMH 1704) TaxID=336963 RepID=C4JXN7_UNCRE|nr:uncharacterized protein UREG_06410 [Uncinocarpus reesii 1704]EEP81545.1 predicted protein [Uncinocarpus reesii 1704]
MGDAFAVVLHSLRILSALEELYADLVKGETGGEASAKQSPEQQPLVNGQQDGLGSPPNPKKRKVTPPGDGCSHSTIVSSLVSRLYARYRELVTKEIREEERRYTQLQNELIRVHEEQKAEPPTLPVAAQQAQPQQKPKPAPEDVPQQSTKPAESRVDLQAPREPGSGPGTPRGFTKTLQPKHEANISIPPTLDAGRHAAPQTAPQPATQYRFENKTPQSMQAHHQPPQWIAANQQPIANIPPTPSTQAQNGGPPIQAHTLAPGFPGTPPGVHIAPTPPGVANARNQPRQQQIGPSVGIRPSPPKPAMQKGIMQPWSIHTPPQRQHVSPYANTPQPPVPAPNRPTQTPQSSNQADKVPNTTSQLPFTVPTGQLPRQAGVNSGPGPLIETVKSAQNIPSSTPINVNIPSFSQRPARLLQSSRPRTPWKKLDALQIPKHPGSPVRPGPEDISPISAVGDQVLFAKMNLKAAKSKAKYLVLLLGLMI